MSKFDLAMSYRNDAVVAAFRKSVRLSQDDADDVFEQMKRWLWLAGISETSHTVMSPALWPIDEMWHTFILFSVDYANYCQRHFGRYLHHVPTTDAARSEMSRRRADSPEAFRADQEKRMVEQYTEVLRTLGRSTLITWARDFPIRYSPEVRRQVFTHEWQADASADIARSDDDASADIAVMDVASLSDHDLISALAANRVENIPPCGECTGYQCVCNGR